MARALIIKNADFSANKVATIDIEEEIPCTGISLNKATAALTSIGGTVALVATTTPSGTTDAVTWASSNSDVATVSNGTITAVGCGTATITATCGNYSATCSVTVTHAVAFAYALDRYLGKSDNKDYLNGGTLNNYAIGFSASGTRKISYDDRTEDRYPILIPKGAAKIAVSCTNFKPYGFWLNSEASATGLSSVAAALPKEAFGTAQSAAGSRTATIPSKTGDYADMDSVALVFQYTGGTISDAAMEEISVTFTA